MELIGTPLDRLMNRREGQVVLRLLQYLPQSECSLGDKKDIENEMEELFYRHLSRDNGSTCSKMNTPSKLSNMLISSVLSFNNIKKNIRKDKFQFNLINNCK
jgi:hypothetical protein